MRLVLLSIDVCIHRKLENTFRSLLRTVYLPTIWRPYIDNRICHERLRDEFGTVVEFGNPSEIRLHVHGMLLVCISDIRIHVVYTLFVMADNSLHYSILLRRKRTDSSHVLFIRIVRSKHFFGQYFSGVLVLNRHILSFWHKCVTMQFNFSAYRFVSFNIGGTLNYYQTQRLLPLWFVGGSFFQF